MLRLMDLVKGVTSEKYANLGCCAERKVALGG
jgi:hypothetical protein